MSLTRDVGLKRHMNIQLTRAPASELPLVRNLVPYYVYDQSEHMGWNCNAEWRWDGCDELPDYWKEPDHHPYVIRVNDDIAGFAFVRPFPGEPERREMGDFFVARKFKGRGVGKVSAFQAFDAHPGKWIIRVLDGNRGARSFWAKVVDEYTQGDFVLTAEKFSDPHSGTWDMQFYRFDSRQSNKTSGGDVQ